MFTHHLLKDILTTSNKTQNEIALDLCVTEASISRWVNGNRVPKVTIFEDFLNACGYEMVIVKKEV